MRGCMYELISLKDLKDPSSSGDEVKRDSKGQRDSWLSQESLLRTRWYAPRLRRTYEPIRILAPQGLLIVQEGIVLCKMCDSKTTFQHNHAGFFNLHLEPFQSPDGGISLMRKRTLPGPFPRPMPRVLARGVPGGWAISYERGTPVQESGLLWMPVSSSLYPSPYILHLTP